jgi:heat shock protein HslJ
MSWPKALLVAAVITIVLGCSPMVVDGYNLAGTSWRAVSVAGERPVDGSEPTIVFELDGRVRGSAGCNRYMSQQSVSIQDGELEIGGTLMTLGACVGDGGADLPVMAVEESFSAVLGTADHIALRGLQLVISGSNGEVVFERKP